jgi:uncharacterized protein YjgD (DUF1641 family)
MAVPIRTAPSTAESAVEIQARLETARISHAKAVLSAYELLQQLHDAHVLDLLRGALDAGDSIVTKLATASASPEAINSVRNLISMARILGSIDPEVLHKLADELTSHPQERVAPPAGLFTALRIFASRDSRRALVGGAAFIQAFGRAMLKAKTT